MVVEKEAEGEDTLHVLPQEREPQARERHRECTGDDETYVYATSHQAQEEQFIRFHEHILTTHLKKVYKSNGLTAAN